MFSLPQLLGIFGFACWVVGKNSTKILQMVVKNGEKSYGRN